MTVRYMRTFLCVCADRTRLTGQRLPPHVYQQPIGAVSENSGVPAPEAHAVASTPDQHVAVGHVLCPNDHRDTAGRSATNTRAGPDSTGRRVTSALRDSVGGH